jgi:hypothetical protein
MAFPISPSDGQLYTSSLGTVYEYEAANDRWLLSSHVMVGETGLRGLTGAQGETGLRGLTGAQGETGLRGLTGAQGETGLRGLTGAQAETGIISGDATLTSLVITGNSSGITGIVVNTLYGTSAPPSAAGLPYGTIYIQYVS